MRVPAVPRRDGSYKIFNLLFKPFFLKNFRLVCVDNEYLHKFFLY